MRRCFWKLHKAECTEASFCATIEKGSSEIMGEHRSRLVLLLLATIATSVGAADKRSIKMHFYLQDEFLDTTIIVAGPNNNVTAFNQFGSVAIFDDKLTEGPSMDSKLVGRAQGVIMGDSMSKLSLLQSFTAVFSSQGKNGTICFLGQNPVPEPAREIAVVGGTGDFRFVQGYATIRTYSLGARANVLSVDVYMKQDLDD